MKARFLTVTLAVALLTLTLASMAPDARAETFTFQPTEKRLNKFQEVENWAEDATVTQNRPGRNHGDWERLNVSSRAGALQYALLDFDPRDPAYGNDALPPNTTITSATLTLYYVAGTSDSAKLEDLVLLEVLRDWDEGTVIWNDTKADAFFGDVAARSIGTENIGANSREFNITPYMRAMLNPGSSAPFRGLAVAYADACDDRNPLQDPCSQQFYSSNDLDPEGDPATRPTCGGPCVPKLTIVADLNGPELLDYRIRNAHFNASAGQAGEYVVAPDWPLNYTFNARDVHGDFRSIQLNFTHKNGTVLWSDELFRPGHFKPNLNDTRQGIFSSYHVWRNRTVDVPPGRYVLNVSAVDTDGNYLNTSRTEDSGQRAVITVEATKPTLRDLVATPARIDEGGQATFRVNVSDANGIRRVWAQVQTPTGENVTTGDFVAEDGRVDALGRGVWSLRHTFEVPGEYEVRIKAQDRPGNVNTSAPHVITVADVTPPQVVNSRVLSAPRTTATNAWQEIGGNLTFAVTAFDNNPLDPEVTLHLYSPVGGEVTFPASKVRGARAGDVWETRWEAEVEFTGASTFPPGDWEYGFVVEDADGNTPTRDTRRAFTLEAPSEPRVAHKAPAAWGNRTPAITATVEDLNLDPSTVTVDLAVNDGPLERVAFEQAGGGGRVTVTVDDGNYFHGDNVTVRVRAQDTLGRAMEEEWTFAVDGFDPRSQLRFKGPHRAAVTQHEVTPATRLNFTGGDDHSGVRHVEYRVAPAAGGAASDWTPATGDVDLTASPAFQGSGAYDVTYRAVDGVGNRESPRNVRVLVDADAPRVKVERAGQRLTLTVTDAGSGVAEVTAHYRNGTGPFFQVPVRLTGAVADGGRYRADLPFTPRGVSASVRVVAEDNLGNARTMDSGSDAALQWVEPNHAPVLDITNPVNRSVLKGNATLAWLVEDADGDDVEVTVAVRPVVVRAWQTLATVQPGTSHHRWDTLNAPDGVYLVRYTATDGTDAATETLTVEVSNTELGVADLKLPKGRLELGKTATLQVTIYRPVKTVTAKVFVVEDGGRRLLDEVPLFDDGAHDDGAAGDGVYANAYTPKEKGQYAVGLNVLYGDNTRLDEDRLSAFTVQQSFTSVVRSNWLWFALGGLALVAIAGAVVVQLIRYGYL